MSNAMINTDIKRLNDGPGDQGFGRFIHNVLEFVFSRYSRGNVSSQNGLGLDKNDLDDLNLRSRNALSRLSRFAKRP